MTLLKFDPVRNFEKLARRMNEIAGDIEKGVDLEFGGFSPRIDIVENEKNVLLFAEMPGISKEEVKVSINQDNILIVKGGKKRPDSMENMSFIRSERNFGEFSRSFMMPESVDRDSIKAKFDNGLLSISLDKKEPEKPKEYTVEIS